jgi:hypothetical protein
MFATDRKLRVFLCHASQDKPIARELYQRLLAEGWIDPWLDEEKLLPGQDWDMEIEQAVEAADVVVVCLSSTSVSKEGYIQRELKFALDVALEKPENTIFVIPVRLDACDLPRRIRSWQYVDYFPAEQRERGLQKLFQSLEVRYGQVDNDKSGVEGDEALPLGPYIKEEKTPPPSVGSTRPGGVESLPSIARIDMGGTALLIFFFILAGIFALGETGDEVKFSLGVSAILSAAYLVFRRQVIADLMTKITFVLFIAAYGLLFYSQSTGWVIADQLGIVAGIPSFAVAVTLAMKFRNEQRSIPYFAVVFALFLILFGTEMIANFFGYYPNLADSIVVSGIAGVILLLLEL